MDLLLLLKIFVALIVPFLLGVLVHELLSKRTASPQRNEEDLKNDYEVFLYFRGVHTGFADHLYRSLIGAGIRVFRNDDELHTGEEVSPGLRSAIENSKISIPIISENYASSKSCLDSLVQMMERQEQRSGHLVLPIFYKVAPSDVRYQKGGFGEEFYCYGRRNFDAEVVAEWKKALAEVSKLKGWESESFADGREGELIDSVLGKVLKKLNKASKLDVSKNLVGIDIHVDNVMKLLNKSSDATLRMGIHGMGGIGKTTLVKVIHNKLSDQFEHRSFIANIRESCHRNGIVYLQNQLISDILGRDAQVCNMDEGIKSRFRDKKVLIILDDVDTTDQLRALAGNKDWFLPGSRIFITTRDKSVLDRAGDIAKYYKLNYMDPKHSLTLFSRHAFRRDPPPNEFSSLARSVVSITGGLPLTLVVLGSFLCGKPAEVWNETIQKMQNVPRMAVRDKLMVSYHALDEDQRQMFLDIACFLTGSDARVASYMWDACGLFARVGIEVLRSRSLIELGDNHEFRMHDRLRDLGGEIVQAESHHEPHERSRLCVYEEALEVLEREKGSEMIQAVSLEKGNSTRFAGSRKLTPEQFQRLPNLRFLHMSDVNLTGNFESLFSKLRWLKWGNCPPNFQATNLRAEELVILDLSGSKISDDWQGWTSMMMAKELKVLNLTGCRSLKSISCISTFKRLEILILRDCSELEKIDPPIGGIENLVSLDLRGCSRLKELPPQMANLGQLEELFLDRTMIQDLPSFIGSLKKLETLSAEDCRFLCQLPASIGHLVNLATLVLSGCVELEALPESIGFLVNLQRLSLGRCHRLREIPNSIGSLKSLTRLDLSWTAIKELPESIQQLQNLEVDIDHSSITELPDGIRRLKKLLE